MRREFRVTWSSSTKLDSMAEINSWRGGGGGHTLGKSKQKPDTHGQLVECFENDKGGEPRLEFDHELVIEGVEVPCVIVFQHLGKHGFRPEGNQVHDCWVYYRC